MSILVNRYNKYYEVYVFVYMSVTTVSQEYCLNKIEKN